MSQYAEQFVNLSRFAHNLVVDEERRCRRFEAGLRPGIRSRVVGLRHYIFANLLGSARAWEVNQRKRQGRKAKGAGTSRDRRAAGEVGVVVDCNLELLIDPWCGSALAARRLDIVLLALKLEIETKPTFSFNDEAVDYEVDEGFKVGIKYCHEVADDAYQVTLNVYDLSQGLALPLLTSFLGKLDNGEKAVGARFHFDVVQNVLRPAGFEL
ncbi:hypothetical protein Droror1_Dr00022862 [Drosera rotundifolia]